MFSKVMAEAGKYVKEEVCCAFIVLVTNVPELYGFTVRSLYKALQNGGLGLATSLVNVG